MRLLAVVLTVVIGAMLWQHFRYLEIRRNTVQDRQPLFYSSARFHVMTFLELAPEGETIAALTRLREQFEGLGQPRWVYAGQVAFAMDSEQLGPSRWDAVILLEYASREAYESAARRPAHREALDAFQRTYSHGMQRPEILNLGVPQFLLFRMFFDMLKGNWTAPALVPVFDAPESVRALMLNERMADLLRLAPVNDQALVVFNLMQPGTSEEQKANTGYGSKMLTRMASLAHGPMHVGRAITLEGRAAFENVVIVYYPGVAYFAELLGSQFFQEIIGDKKLGDTLAVPTVPILSRL
jgi:hypothetical protein